MMKEKFNLQDHKTKALNDEEEIEHIRAVLIEYHKFLNGFNDPSIFNVPIEFIDNFLVKFKPKER